jgi:DNA-binding CsgD family transcriptional regulator
VIDILREERTSEALRKMDGAVRKAFAAVKDEMNVHRETINQNTNDLQACYEYLAEIDRKLDKLAERLDELQYTVTPEQRVPEGIVLTHREQEAFMVLYTADDPVTSLEVARRLGLTVEMVEQYLFSISSKGVPILKTFANGKVYHSLDLKFKDLQARRNILNISEEISQELLRDKAI